MAAIRLPPSNKRVRVGRRGVVKGSVDELYVAPALERDAAISMLLENTAVCEKYAFAPVGCGRCHPCRVDKFLRDVGARK